MLTDLLLDYLEEMLHLNGQMTVKQALNTLQTVLIKEPILKHPDPSKRYTVSTDASDQAAAAVLTQEYPGNILK